jgi:hypothetical protein
MKATVAARLNSEGPRQMAGLKGDEAASRDRTAGVNRDG